METRARVGANAHAKAIAKLNERIEKCEEEIKANERWETTRTIRKDERGGDDTEDEVVLTSKLVGAEDLRIDLEVMLRERDVLSGHLAAAETSAVGAKMNDAAEAFDEGATFVGARLAVDPASIEFEASRRLLCESMLCQQRYDGSRALDASPECIAIFASPARAHTAIPCALRTFLNCSLPTGFGKKSKPHLEHLS